jgi:hypothetical protein
VIIVIALLALGAIAWLGRLGPFAPPVDRSAALAAALTLDASQHGHSDQIVCGRLLDLSQPSDNAYSCIVVETSADGSELPTLQEAVDYAPDGTWTVEDVRSFP